MTHKSNGSFVCDICKRPWVTMALALACEKNHNVVMIPVYREDVIKLMMYLSNGDSKLIPTRLLETLQQYVK